MEKRARLFRMVFATFFCALWSSTGRAQVTVTCPPAPNLVKVTVSATISFDATSNLYTYQYTVSSDASSQQEVSDFALDFAPPVSGVTSPTGWINTFFHGRSTIHWKDVIAAPLPADQPDNGQVPPGLNQIKPGASLGGFSFKSPNPPGPVSFFALGFTDLLGGDTEIDAEDVMDACPQSTGGFFDVAVTGTTQGPVTFIPVQIDIKPGSSPNAINPADQGVTPVAILSTATFDATTVDPSTAQFGPAGASPQDGAGHIEDVNGDGLPDLVMQFPTQATGIACGDTSATLKAKTFGGKRVQGSDSIITVDCKKGP